MWQGGWWADTPADGVSHTVRIMTNHKNSHNESAGLQRGSLEASHLISIWLTSQVGVSVSIKQRFGPSTPKSQADLVSLAGLSHWFEKFYWFDRARGGLDHVYKWLRAAVLFPFTF